ncbi:MAG TPA: DoxX family protein [Candidatus Bathyarchaeia archaeon]|nr:DoxX family protein [Candidatus Bathyarchaeia archaeon]
MWIFFLLGRILFGGYFLLSGIKHFTNAGILTEYADSKKVPLARAAVLAAGILLLIGGAGILLGIFVDMAVAALVVFLLTVSIMVHNFWEETGLERTANLINFQKNMALLGAALLVLFIPTPWPFSL